MMILLLESGVNYEVNNSSQETYFPVFPVFLFLRIF